MTTQRDVLIIGGGVIGLTTAWYLASESKLRVSVVERSEFGREASWAGAGIIPPANRERATNPFNRLLGLSTELWPALSQQLRDRTGLDNGYRRCGGIELQSGVSESQLQTWRDEGITFERLSGPQLRQREPALAPVVEDGYYQPDMAQVRNPRHLKALLADCAALGVELLPRTSVIGFRAEGGRVVNAMSESGDLFAERFLIASGAWSDELLASLGVKLDIYPVRGQMVLFNPGHALLKSIILAGKDYLVPRDDGRILAGSTEEDVGFAKYTTEEAIAELTRFARSLVPALAEVPPESTWAGLRPATRDELPHLGRVPGISNLFLAAGHFRSGLMLSPATGRVMADLLTDRPPAVPLDAFDPARRLQ